MVPKQAKPASNPGLRPQMSVCHTHTSVVDYLAAFELHPGPFCSEAIYLVSVSDHQFSYLTLMLRVVTRQWPAQEETAADGTELAENFPPQGFIVAK